MCKERVAIRGHRVRSGMYLRLLGGLTLEGSGLRRPKPLLLLAYLALEGSQHRRALADLVWPGAVDARDSLSTTLRRLRGVLGSLLIVDADQIATTVRHDVAEFEEAVRSGEPSDVVHAYGGAFLDGLTLPLRGEIEDWIVETRERLAGLARKAYVTQARRALDRGDTAAAACLGEVAWALPHAPPFDQQGLETMAWLLRSSRSPRYGDVEREAKHLGLVLERDEASVAGGTAGRIALSIPATSFIGRDREMAEIAAVFARPHGRLVTLHGPGGSGKSRLAVEVVDRLVRDGTPLDAAVVVPLEAVQRAGLVGDAVVAAMGLVASPDLAAERQVIRAIGARRVVLVLDNMEHLFEARAFVAELVRTCPALRVLVTSRVALNLTDEHRIAVDGLPLEPDGDQDGAVELMWDRMRQIGSTPGSAEDARHVCRILDGSPLAIELAAAMTRTASLGELAAQLADDLTVLVNRDSTVTERHRSLIAALDVSWQLLGTRLQQAIARLAVFHGGFTAAEAEAVVNVDRSVLAELVDASLVRALPSERFERHPLIGQFLSAKLAADSAIEAAVKQRHAEYFLDEVRERDHAMLGAEATQVAAWLETSLANVRAAWSWAVQQGDLERLAAAAWPLVHFAEMRGRFTDVGAMYDEVASGAEHLASNDDTARVLAAILACRTFVLFRSGRYAETLEQGQAALACFGGVERPLVTWGAWAARQGMALSLAALGRLDEGLALVRDNVAMCETVRAGGADDARLRRTLDVMEGTSHETLAVVAIQAGAFEVALEHLDDAVGLLTPHRPYGLGYIYWSLGQAYLGIGAVDAADERLQKGLRFAAATGFRNQVGHLLNEVARVQLSRAELAVAEATCERTITLAVESGDRALEVSARAAFGCAALRAGRVDDARSRFRDAVALAHEAACYPAAMEAVVGLAKLAAAEKREREAVRLYAFVSTSPYATAALVSAAEEGLAGLAQRMDPAAYRRDHESGATASPERVFVAL